MKTDSLSEGGKEKEAAPRERSRESLQYTAEIEKINIMFWQHKWVIYDIISHSFRVA